MGLQLFYCSEQSRQLGEKIYGTASMGDVWFLIEHPSPWGPNALRDSNLSPAVKRYLNGILKTIPRSKLLFIKQSRVVSDGLTMFAVFCRENKPTILKFKIRNYEQLFDIDLASIAAESSLGGGTISDEPLYLVCTHGKRDKCCAKFGYPIYKFISKCTDGLAWQCSHVGGDRFAANLICFPHGLFYAHVTEGSGQSIIDAYVQQQLILDKYRGRACYSSPVQAADFFVRSESKITSIDELHHIDYERVNESLWRIRFATSDARRVYEVKVRRAMSEFQSYRTCHSTEEERVVQYLLDDYRVMSDESLMRS